MDKRRPQKPLNKAQAERAVFPNGIGISFDGDGNVRLKIGTMVHKSIGKLGSQEFPVALWIHKEVLKELVTTINEGDGKDFHYEAAKVIHAQGPVGNCDCGD